MAFLSQGSISQSFSSSREFQDRSNKSNLCFGKVFFWCNGCSITFRFSFFSTFDSTKWCHMEVQHGGRPSCLAMADPKTALFGLEIYTLRLTASKIGSFSLCFILRRHCQGWNLIFQFLIGHASTQKCHMTCENAWGQIPNDKHGFSKTCLAMLAALGVCLARAAAILAEK